MNKIDPTTLGAIYGEVGKNYRFFLNWRYVLIAGHLVSLWVLAQAYSWLHEHQIFLTWIVFPLGLLFTCFFWALEFRNRDLYQACMNSGEMIEQALLSDSSHQLGVFAA